MPASKSSDFCDYFQFIGQDKSMTHLIDLVHRIAPTSSPVLIHGESGTGKEHLARFIHCLSPRRSSPFVKIDCATLPQDLMEAELFGYEKGAFTGAVDTKAGKLEKGHNGTVFLDNITALNHAMQGSITRVIQESSYERLGGNEQIRINARFISCLNENPTVAVSKGALRKDLFYQLGVICLELPPLRRRPSDIPLLVHYFLRELSRYAPEESPQIDEEAMNFLSSYYWPGNIRQLINVLERTLITCSNKKITFKDIQLHQSELQEELIASASYNEMTLEELEKRYIHIILKKCHGNKSKAAKVLGINRKTLLEKRKKYEL